MISLHIEQAQLDQLIPLIQEKLAEGGCVRFSPNGVSMLPMLRQGIDSVLISPLPSKLKKYDLILYQRTNGRYVLHRIIKTGEELTCMGDNQFVKETGIRRDQLIGLVTAFFRRDRHISVGNKAYLIYCRVWHYTRFIRRVWKKSLRCISRNH